MTNMTMSQQAFSFYEDQNTKRIKKRIILGVAMYLVKNLGNTTHLLTAAVFNVFKFKILV